MRSTVFIFCLLLAGCGTLFNSEPPPAYVVFFPDNSLDITPDAQAIVKSAAAKASFNPGQMVAVAGPSTKIAPGYNPGLAEPRIAAVERALVAAGVPTSRLVRASLTTANAKVDATGAQRVEIRLVDKPES
jgi:outer membrane protein OmpA-like peptidoglycan-associated protein